MYNRYIPQNDGTYRRSRVVPPPAPQQAPPHREEPRREAREVPVPQPPPCQTATPCANAPRPIPPRPKTPPVSIGTFLKQLIPGGFDTEDLIVVLLLLLMAGDCREDQNTALLTLVLYLFV